MPRGLSALQASADCGLAWFIFGLETGGEAEYESQLFAEVFYSLEDPAVLENI
jgi:hypothetical protein